MAGPSAICLLALAAFGWSVMTPARAGSGSVEIFVLAKAGDTAGVEKLVAGGADINARDETGQTPLITAALARQDGVAEFLVSHGASLEARTKKGMTALHAAAYSGDKAIAEMLLKYGADVNDQANIAGITPLHAAAEENHADIVEALVKAGADIRLVEVNGYTAGSRAGWREHWDIVRYLLASGDICQPEAVAGAWLYEKCTHLGKAP